MNNNNLYHEWELSVVPSKWGVSAYPDKYQRLIAWQAYLEKAPSFHHNSPRIPDYKTWLRENGHTGEADLIEDEERRAEILSATRRDAEKDRIIKDRRNIRRAYGPYEYIGITADERERITAYLRMSLGVPSAKSSMGGIQWEDHGIMLTDGGTQVAKMHHTKLSDYGKQVMDNVWKILEGTNNTL